jgi:ribokinase
MPTDPDGPPRVVVVGSVNIDLIVTAPELPRPGETVLGREFSTVPGGKGANQAIGAARAGARTTFLGAIGSDAFGVTLKARLVSSTVDTSLLRTVYGASGVALIVVDDYGENAIVVAPGANGAFSGLTEAELDAIAQAQVLLCQLEIPVATVTAACLAARAAGTRVVLNAAPALALPDELLAAVDLLVVNEVEAIELARVASPDVDSGDEPDTEDVIDGLLALVPRVVLTRGAAGAWYAERDAEPVEVPAPVVEPVDTTAAGDAFTGALALAWAEGRDLVDAVRWASAAGAVAVQRLGASSALPERAAIEELYQSTYRSVGR